MMRQNLDEFLLEAAEKRTSKREMECAVVASQIPFRSALRPRHGTDDVFDPVFGIPIPRLGVDGFDDALSSKSKGRGQSIDPLPCLASLPEATSPVCRSDGFSPSNFEARRCPYNQWLARRDSPCDWITKFASFLLRW